MIRNIAGAIAGLLVAFVVIWLVEWIGHAIFPPPPDLDFSDTDAIRPYIATLPLMALLFPLAAWFLGTLTGSLVACRIGTARPLIFSSVVGGLVFAATVANLILIPHPLWFAIVALVGIVLSAWLAMQVASKEN